MFKSKELLTLHRSRVTTYDPEKLVFEGVEDYDVYNISAPFLIDGQQVLAGRIEHRSNENSMIGLFSLTPSGTWNWLKDAVHLKLQDPFITVVDDKIILGGVEVKFIEGRVEKWRTVFYRLDSLQKAEYLLAGPWGMKDIRLLELASHKLLILTRPQGRKAARGKIGVLLVSELSELSEASLMNAPLLKNQFIDIEWGGANEMYLIDGRVCVLGHVGSKDKDNQLHYRAMTFELTTDFSGILNPKIIAERKDFLSGPSKRPELKDIVFSGGLTFDGSQTILYVGTGDSEAQKVTIDHPFR